MAHWETSDGPLLRRNRYHREIGSMTVHTETIDGITYTLSIEQEDIEVRGNAMASGDDTVDTAAENEIIERLDNGDVWAWFGATCTASITIDGETFEGKDHLGACCYTGLEEFIAEGGYWPDMRSEAKGALRLELQSAIKRGELAAGELVKVGSN